ncbi:fungal-specific transcription factor domain-containing protein [Rostrohypoxylon terebratum]|nr:fungal-specific transcription factor domain-containing protein [Rostrohypoxylon terebratum]
MRTKSSEPQTKECRTCVLRRIRCDGTLPHCKKCIKKDTQCPGYGQHIRWVNAIASRGRFKGLGKPEQPKLADPAPRTTYGSPRSPLGFIPLDSSESACSSGTESVLGLLPESDQDQLLQYYSSNIAPINVWFDSPQNGYKQLVIPLARRQSALRLAILGISAAHSSDDLEIDKSFSQLACHTAMTTITSQIKILVGRELGKFDIQAVQDAEVLPAVLATMLVLSNYSLLESDISLAKIHLQAIRVLIRTPMLNNECNGDLTSFLRNQIASYDVLTCTTLFDPEHIRNAIVPGIKPKPVIFNDYLNIIHDITMRSVGEVAQESNQGFSLSKIETQLELARGSSLLAGGPLSTQCTQSSYRDFIRLTESFHHAGFLYACKRLPYLAEAREIQEYHVSKLFSVFSQFEDMHFSVVRLSWPIFVGGICSCGHTERMGIITALCRTLSKSRFRFYDSVLVFLEEHWASQDQDWISRAQEWERRGTPLVVV